MTTRLMTHRMQFLVLAAALLTAASAYAEAPSPDAVCASWAGNAVIGGQHAMLGHARRLVPLSEEVMVELLEHHQFLEIDGIPVLVEDHSTPEGRAFLEASVFYGFDFVKHSAPAQLPETPQQLLALFVEICHKAQVASR